MSLYQPVSPRKSLNKAYLKVKPNRIQIEADSIDLMVYKLYNLTWEEVKIVDPAFAMSAEEYEKYSFE